MPTHNPNIGFRRIVNKLINMVQVPLGWLKNGPQRKGWRDGGPGRGPRP